jgi:N-acetylneuraminic acid mutarotase
MNSHRVLPFILIFSLILILTVVGPANASSDFWVSKANLPVGWGTRPSIGPIGKAVTVSGQIYLFYANYTYLYDASTNTWFSKTSMPTQQSNFAVAACLGKAYVFGEESNEAYNPATDTWNSIAPMPTPRSNMEANAVDGKIYLISGLLPQDGHPGPTMSNVNEVYNAASNTWTTDAPIPTPVYNYASAVVGSKIYIIGGDAVSGYADGVAITNPCNLTQVFNTQTNSWSYEQPLPIPLANSGAGATTGTFTPTKIYVFGGGNIGDVYNFTQIYNPDTETWTLGASMPTARFDLSVAVVNDTFYVLGGYNDTYSTPINEQYFPSNYQANNQLTSPSPSVPEFPAWLILAVTILMFTVIILKRKYRMKRFYALTNKAFAIGSNREKLRLITIKTIVNRVTF